MAKIISGVEFETEVLKSDVPVLVDFFAEWCGPCKMIAPILDSVSAELEGKAKVVKVDIDQSMALAAKYKVMSVPTLVFIKNGEVVDQVVGATSKDMLTGKLNALM